MNKVLLTCSTLIFLMSSSLWAAEDGATWREPGRFGGMIAQTSDGTQGGFVYEANSFEVNLTFDASTSLPGPDHTNQFGMSGDLGTTLRLGSRYAIGDFNYISMGAQGYCTYFAHDDGVNIGSSFALGPYIGFQRHFAGTHFMLTAWIMPYYYESIASNDGNGGIDHTITSHYFQTGGIGFAYLF